MATRSSEATAPIVEATFSWEFISITVIALFASLAFIWNGFVGLNWTPAFWFLFSVPTALFAISTYYRFRRPDEQKLIEFTLYMSLWLAFPIFAVRLTYLAVTLGFPMQDRFFLTADMAMGFNWIVWDKFVYAHQLFYKIQSIAYFSSFWQPFLTIPILTLYGPRDRNGQLLSAMLLALAATISVFGFMPARGPAFDAGIATNLDAIMIALRAKSASPVPYNGIICFPSFHTVMAILFTWAHRGLRWTFIPFGLLNFLMLTAIPIFGDHYLVDMVAGAAIAIVSILIMTRISRPSLMAMESTV